MCLILVAWQTNPDFPLVVAANRDEFHARPTAAAARWDNAPHILGGRDLEAGGTWMGVTETGRFAAVTNVREPGTPPGKRSRGELTAQFLRGATSAGEFCRGIHGADYSGFNLLLADRNQLWYCSNRDGAPRPLAPGIYGVSNHLLDTPWPKLASAKQRFEQAMTQLPASEAFFSILGDREIVPDDALPNTGVPLEWERLLSAVFVQSPTYGTRASTVLRMDANQHIHLEERSFVPDGRETQSSVISTRV